MAEDVELDYEYYTQRALKRVVRDVLQITAELGATPGDHHFYIEFETRAFGVSIPETLREQYPDRMTIVLQHQFDNLVVSEENFAVTLRFKGAEARLIIPFEALVSFADPSVEFGLRFSPPAPTPRGAPEPPSAEAKDASPSTEPSKDGADVVRLDAFRKK
ncbi:MAG TPA: ClpXP protease specificity-enhancing factor SspB [Parvularculaceae bacterium]|nr:ClpXP protease specificity-enhancing factor SspB [Parvularculaceae bacterium]